MSYPPQGYPQQPPPGWHGYGGPPNQFAPPPRNGGGRWVWVLMASAVVVTVAVVVAGLLLSGSDDSSGGVAQTATSTAPQDQSPSSTTTTTAPSTTSSAPPTTTTTTTSAPPTAAPGSAICEGFTAGPGAQTPAGWKPVVGPRGLAYDVPPDWVVEKCGVLVGWEKKCDDGPFGYCPVRTMSGAASLENKTCLHQVRGMAGLPGASNAPDIDEAVKIESGLVKDIYTSSDGKHVPTVSLSAPKNITVDGAPAVQVIATVTDIQSDDCTAPSALHSMVATQGPLQEGPVLFVISLEQGYPGAPDPSVIDQMVSSLRRADRAR